MALTAQSKLASPNYASTVVRLLVKETFNLAANATKNYAAATLIGAANVGEYDLSTLSVELLVLDNEASSPTNGFYVDATAAAVVGIKTDGSVRIVNTYSAQLSFMVRISVRRIAPN